MNLNNKLLSLCAFTLPLVSYGQDNSVNVNKKPNILFICVDDLRKDLGCYGSVVKTPNIDELAAEGSLFHNQYVQAPLSSASRYCMLSGHLPRRISDTTNEACRTRFSEEPEKEIPETVFHHLKRNGYYTVGIGKISHSPDGYVYPYNAKRSNQLECPYSWNEMLLDTGQWGTGWNAFFALPNGQNRTDLKYNIKPYMCANLEDTDLPDGQIADLAVKKLKELNEKNKPFCLAVGFFKPHLPFISPKKYWNLYDEEDIPLAPMKDLPLNCDPSTLHGSNEFNAYKLGDEKASLKKNVSNEYARKLRHAYFSCVSYTDAQIGKVLKALEETGQKENTIIVLWGDHGWHLGDYRIWGKQTFHEVALNSPLIIKSPNCKKGIENKRIVSAIDIFPTILELTGIKEPKGLDGHSFAELLNNPEDKEWKDVSYSFYSGSYGVSMRVPGYRLSVYYRNTKRIVELYHYTNDGIERKNIANENPDLVKTLLPLWRKGATHEFY